MSWQEPNNLAGSRGMAYIQPGVHGRSSFQQLGPYAAPSNSPKSLTPLMNRHPLASRHGNMSGFYGNKGTPHGNMVRRGSDVLLEQARRGNVQHFRRALQRQRSRSRDDITRMQLDDAGYGSDSNNGDSRATRHWNQPSPGLAGVTDLKTSSSFSSLMTADNSTGYSTEHRDTSQVNANSDLTSTATDQSSKSQDSEHVKQSNVTINAPQTDSSSKAKKSFGSLVRRRRKPTNKTCTIVKYTCVIFFLALLALLIFGIYAAVTKMFDDRGDAISEVTSIESSTTKMTL